MPKYINASLTFCLTGASPPPPALPVGVKLSGALPLTGPWLVWRETTGVKGRTVRVATGTGGFGTGVDVAAGPGGAGGGPSAGRHCGLALVAAGGAALVTGRAGTG